MNTVCHEHPYFCTYVCLTWQSLNFHWLAAYSYFFSFLWLPHSSWQLNNFSYFHFFFYFTLRQPAPSYLLFHFYGASKCFFSWGNFLPLQMPNHNKFFFPAGAKKRNLRLLTSSLFILLFFFISWHFLFGYILCTNPKFLTCGNVAMIIISCLYKTSRAPRNIKKRENSRNCIAGYFGTCHRSCLRQVRNERDFHGDGKIYPARKCDHLFVHRSGFVTDIWLWFNADRSGI